MLALFILTLRRGDDSPSAAEQPTMAPSPDGTLRGHDIAALKS
jgi:hypothetical protein